MGHAISQDDAPWEYYVHIVDWDRRHNVLHGGADSRNPGGAAMIASSPRRASAVDAASSKTFHQRAFSSR